VRISGSLAIELQHLEPVIIDRINGYFGYGAVKRLKILQGPLPHPAETPRSGVTVDPEVAAAVDSEVAPVGDDGLRQALAGFGRALCARTAKNRKS
jgi:hypothetical protein